MYLACPEPGHDAAIQGLFINAPNIDWGEDGA